MVKAIFTLLGAFCVYVMATMSYAGIAVLMGIESACIPLPSELIMPYAGAMTVPDVSAALGAQYGVGLPVFNLLAAGIAGALGCNLGSEVAYWVGAKGGRPAIERYGRYLLISKREIALADRWFDKGGPWIVFVARLLPVVRTFVAFPAGVARMDRVTFHAYTFLGSLPWCLALAYAGKQLGVRLLDDHSPLKHFMHRFDAVIGGAIVLAAAYFVWSRVKTYRELQAEGAAAKAD
ncbi:MAG TPA: DedA family protein [Polyangiaceae bacterium]|nr:DedA family protein [Polyangiaceae bacterium]